VASFRSCGAGRRECVVYWLMSSSAPGRIQRMVHPEHSATAWHYQVDPAWLTAFWVELAKSGERVLAQVHTHGGRACHSPTDDDGALVYQAGFLSLVLPGFAMRNDSAQNAFLAELDESGKWREVTIEERLRWK